MTTTFSPTLQGLRLALDTDPSDQLARLALADWLEEQGDEDAAACHRWMVRAGAVPFDSRRLGVTPVWRVEPWWSWISSSCNHSRLAECSRIPDALWHHLRESEERTARSFMTCQEAEDALMGAWRATPKEERP